MKDVKRLDRKAGRVHTRAIDGKALYAQRERDLTMEEILKEGLNLNVVNLPEYMEGHADDINPLIMEKLRNGEFSVQKVLDLHTLSVDEARETFHDFLNDAVRTQIHCVKIIHGRGLKSRKGPVLKERLKGWIVRAMHRKWIVAFASARMRDGGPGATLILLKTTARKQRMTIIG